jgi:hypothetical protein
VREGGVESCGERRVGGDSEGEEGREVIVNLGSTEEERGE